MWFKGYNIKPDTLNLIEEKMGTSLEHICTGENFLNRTPMTQAVRSVVDKWDFMKPNNTVNRIKLDKIVCILYRLGKEPHQPYI